MRKARLGTLSSVLIALLCFCFPWIEIRCDNPRGGIFSGKGQDQIVISQSGLQMTYGGFTTTVNGNAPSEQDQIQLNRQTAGKSFLAPVMIVYALCLLFILAIGFLVPEWNRFRVLAGLGILAAEILLMVQLAIGFAIVDETPRRQGSNGWSYTTWFWIALAATVAPLFILLFSPGGEYAEPCQTEDGNNRPLPSMPDRGSPDAEV